MIVRINVCMYEYIYLRVCNCHCPFSMCVYMCMYNFVCMYVYMYTCIHVYV